jgi:spore germination protein GerM
MPTLSGFVLLSFASFIVFFSSTSIGQVKKTSDSLREIKLFFTNPNLPDSNDCDSGEFVARRIPNTARVADAALKLLFAGPTQEEKTKGMQSIVPLGEYYIGVTVRKGIAIVNFRPGAEKLLYVTGPICMQQTVLAPITKTLKQFGTIKSVDFAVNGKIIEDWDA